MSTPTPPIPDALRRYVVLFNRGSYWDSHEVLEEQWRENGSDFYQGLILLASAFVHLRRGNAAGIVSQLRKAEDALRSYAPSYLGLDVSEILHRAERVRHAVGANVSAPPEDLPALVPVLRLTLEPSLVMGTEQELEEG